MGSLAAALAAPRDRTRRSPKDGWLFVKNCNGSAARRRWLQRQRAHVVADDASLPLPFAAGALKDDDVGGRQRALEEARVALWQQTARPVAARMGALDQVAGQHGIGLRTGEVK